MPAASFFEAAPADPPGPGIRQWQIGSGHCRWILADEDAGAEALMCGAPAERRRPFCAEHCARVYMPRVPEEGPEGAEIEGAEAEPIKTESVEAEKTTGDEGANHQEAE